MLVNALSALSEISRQFDLKSLAADRTVMAEPTNQELATEIAVLKQTMETHKQEYKTDIARLAAQMVNWRTDMAQQENRQLLAVIIFGMSSAIRLWACRSSG